MLGTLYAPPLPADLQSSFGRPADSRLCLELRIPQWRWAFSRSPRNKGKCGQTRSVKDKFKTIISKRPEVFCVPAKQCLALLSLFRRVAFSPHFLLLQLLKAQMKNSHHGAHPGGGRTGQGQIQAVFPNQPSLCCSKSELEKGPT